MKLCKKCNSLKNEGEFHMNKSKKDGLGSSCKSCQNGTSKKHYAENSETYKENSLRNRVRLREMVDNIKQSNPCKDCGVFYPPCVMDFDHLHSKEGNVASLVSKGASWRKIQQEISKCELVCSNCHRIRTHLGR